MINKFNKLKDILKQTDTWIAMENTIENSPWHRESSVAVHTEMTLDHYIQNYMDFRPPHAQILTLISLLFHDTGKPGAMKHCHSKERGDYVRFSGHEKVSARIWEDFAVRNWEFLRDLFFFGPMDILIITWMIEHHLPFGIQKPQKLQALRDTTFMMFGREHFIYYDMILSDCCGRISDDHSEKIKNTTDWLDNLFLIEPSDEEALISSRIEESGKILYVLIGASGSGKSTFTKELMKSDSSIVSYSWDDLRVQWYKSKNPEHGCDNNIELYKCAFEYANDNTKEFNKYKDAVFMTNLLGNKNIIVDNMNLSKKSRAFCVTEAKKKGYKTIGVVFPIDKDTLLDRAISRTDKKVPVANVADMYERVSMPSIGGEFDNVWVCPNNLK